MTPFCNIIGPESTREYLYNHLLLYYLYIQLIITYLYPHIFLYYTHIMSTWYKHIVLPHTHYSHIDSHILYQPLYMGENLPPPTPRPPTTRNKLLLHVYYTPKLVLNLKFQYCFNIISIRHLCKTHFLYFFILFYTFYT